MSTKRFPTGEQVTLEVDGREVAVSVGIRVSRTTGDIFNPYGRPMPEYDVELDECEPNDPATRAAAEQWVERNARRFIDEALAYAEQMKEVA